MLRLLRTVFAAGLAMLVGPLASFGQPVEGRLDRVAAWASTAIATVAARPSLDASGIEGVVVDEDGHALSDVRVRILGPVTLARTTDRRGAFRFSSLPTGQYLVRAYAAGYRAAMSSRLDLTEGPASPLRLTLVRERGRRRPSATQPTAPDRDQSQTAETLQAGFGLLAPVDALPLSPEDADERGDRDQPRAADPSTGGAGGNEEAAGEFVWRLRRLGRSPLKDETTGAGIEPGGSDFVPEAVTAVEQALGTSVRMAPSLFDDSLTGEVNLLASGTFDSPLQLLSPEHVAHNVTYASVGSVAGDLGTWAVRGALTQGDVSSWIVAGFLVAPEASRHAYDVGMSYSMQRYDGGNAAALAAVSEGARNATEIYGFDQWRVSPRVSVGYGGRYSHYDYLADGGLLSPRASVTVSPLEDVRVHVLAARRMVAPGAEEFVPGVSAGLWLPPERTFSPLLADEGFVAERNTHYEVGIEHDLDSEVLVAFRAYEQQVDDQLATLFHVSPSAAGPGDLGHYYVATAGDVQTRGWAASVSHQVGTVRSTVEYAQARAVWSPDRTAAQVARVAGSAVRDGAEDLVDITTSVRAAIPQTATRLFVLYRLSSGFADVEDVRTGARFNVQINQSLPFMNFRRAEWEMMVDVRNLFREPVPDASLYDELLVVNPPKRFVGGLLVRF